VIFFFIDSCPSGHTGTSLLKKFQIFQSVANLD